MIRLRLRRGWRRLGERRLEEQRLGERRELGCDGRWHLVVATGATIQQGFLRVDGRGKRAGVLHGGKSLLSGNAAKSELFVLNHFEFSEKISNDLVQIRKCELIESFPLLRKNYTNFLHANYFSELLLKCEIPEEESFDYFEMLKKTISDLSDTKSSIEIKFDFELKLMKLLGIEPNLEKCVKCNGDIWNLLSNKNILPKYSAPHQFDASLSGIRCPNCCIVNSFVTYLNPGSMAFFYSRQKTLSNISLVKPTFKSLEELDKAFLKYFRYFFGKKIISHALLKENLWKN